MKAKMLVVTMAAGALCGVAMLDKVHAQAAPGAVYVFHSKAMGGCPALDWHVVAGEGGTLDGMIAWNDMKSMAHATGSIDATRNFKMTATEIGGSGRTATVSGQARKDGWLVANISGPGVNCKHVTIPIWRPGGPGPG
jgi:hypothetical protein